MRIVRRASLKWSALPSLSLTLSLLFITQGCSSPKLKADSPSPSAVPQQKAEWENDYANLAKISENINLDTMHDSDVLCTVNGVTITVGDYRRQLKLQREQIQANIGAHPELEDQLLSDAKKRSVSLTSDEKQKLVAGTRKTENVTSGAIKQYLKERKMTSADFDQQVLSLGLAMKDAVSLTRQTLLTQMVDRQLLVATAREKGFQTAAYNKYVEARHDPQYKIAMQSTGLTENQAETEIVETELMRMMLEEILKNAKVSDSEIRQLYDKNAASLKHGERIRFSQIILACPKNDLPGQDSVRSQMKKQLPNLSKAELDTKVSDFIRAQRSKARELLVRALKGEDFAKLANQYTEDPMNKQVQNGGDLGYKTKDSLDPEFVSAVWPLKVGQVLSRVLETPFGYHIIKITAHEPPGLIPYAEVKDEIKDSLEQKNKEKTLQDWLVDKHKNTPIKISQQLQAVIATKPTKTP